MIKVKIFLTHPARPGIIKGPLTFATKESHHKTWNAIWHSVNLLYRHWRYDGYNIEMKKVDI